MRNDNHAAAPIVNHNAIGLTAGVIVNQTIWAVMAVRVLIARRVDATRHRVTAVFRHTASYRGERYDHNGSFAEGALTTHCGHSNIRSFFGR